MRTLIDFFTWWLWRRWRIYCPNVDARWLCARPDFMLSLLDYDEQFCSPCTFNERHCGKLPGTHPIKIAMIGFPMDEKE